MKLKITLLISILITASIPSTSFGVENGTDAAGDPNAVNVSESSGFLYAPRIVLTAAHLFGNDKYNIDRPVSVKFPGRASNSGGILSIKTFIAPGYLDRKNPKSSRTDDFAILVLESPMVMKNKVKVATKENISNFIQNKTQVNMVGYGIQYDRNKIPTVNSVAKFPKKLASRILFDDEIRNVKKSLPIDAEYNQDIYFEQIPSQGNVCDGDSGAGWFVQDGTTRIYLGAASSGLGGPNCGKDGVWDPNGSTASADAAYRFLDLLKQAEDYAKSAPITSRCFKGYVFKVIAGNKCPKNFKKVS